MFIEIPQCHPSQHGYIRHVWDCCSLPYLVGSCQFFDYIAATLCPGALGCKSLHLLSCMMRRWRNFRHAADEKPGQVDEAMSVLKPDQRGNHRDYISRQSTLEYRFADRASLLVFRIIYHPSTFLEHCGYKLEYLPSSSRGRQFQQTPFENSLTKIHAISKCATIILIENIVQILYLVWIDSDARCWVP